MSRVAGGIITAVGMLSFKLRSVEMELRKMYIRETAGFGTETERRSNSN